MIFIINNIDKSVFSLRINKTVNEPARLKILTLLYIVENAEFNYLLDNTLLTKGNLSSHLQRLELDSLVSIHKSFKNKIPRTIIGITAKGISEYEGYKESITKLLNTTN